MSREKANERINSRVGKTTAHTPHVGIIIAVSAIVVFALVGTIIYLILGDKDADQYNSVVTPDNVEEAIAELDNKDATPMGSYQVTMNTEWIFPDAASASTNAYVANSNSNRNTVFFTIALASDASTDIYRSPYLPIGSHLEDIKLDTALDAGTYPAVMTYHLVDEENKEVSSVTVSMTLTIEN